MSDDTPVSVGIYWRPGTWDLARSAYVADLDSDEDCPDAFIGWLGRALVAHARRTPAERVVAVDSAVVPQSPRRGFNKRHSLRPSTIVEVEEAIIADRRELGLVVSRSQFAQDAVVAAAAESKRRLGRDLPPPPARLSNRPPRRRQMGRG